MYVADLRREFFDLLIDQRVLVVVNFDVDAICSVKILQTLLRCDHIMHTVIPVRGKSDLIQTFEEHFSHRGQQENDGGSDEEDEVGSRPSFRRVVLINCGGTIDLVDFLDPPPDVIIFVADSHKPTDVCNIYSDGQVRLLNRQEDDEDVPEYDSIFKDSDAEDEDDDGGGGGSGSKGRGEEDRSGGEDDDAEDLDGAEGSNVTAKRSRFDAKSILKRRERRLWEEKRSKILFEYQQFSYYGSSTALLMYDLAWKMSRDTNDLLWWAIVGHTEQFLLLKSEAEKYLVGVASIRDHVARLNNSGGGGTSGGDESSQQQSVDCTKISFQKELNLNLYRHWSIFESVCHTVYTSGKFKIWSLKGKQRLSEFLAESGLPLSQCRQRFASMDLALRNNIVSLFEEKADKYGLDDITFGTFCASTGYRSRFSAPDVFFATLSLMEHWRGGDSSSSAAVDAFLEAMDSLSRPKVELLERGIGRAKELLGLIFKQVQNFLDMRLVVSAGPFLYAIMQDETNRADLRLFSQPNCLMLLAQYTLRAHAAVTGSKKVQSLPLVVSASLDVAQGTCLVLGVPPVNDRSRRNLLGKAFEQAARKTSSRYLLDYFDASVVQLKTEDRSKFFDGLISLLT